MLQSRVLQDQLLQALLQPDECVISYLSENYFIFDVQLSVEKPDGGVFDDQLGDLVGPEYVPVQLLHIAIHNGQVLDLAPCPVGVINRIGVKRKKCSKDEIFGKPSQSNCHAS